MLCYYYQSGSEGKKSKGGCVMKSTGIVRKVDELGRIVLPIELRKGAC